MTLNLTQSAPSTVPASDKPALTLIVLTDFFPAAHRAIKYAAELAAPLGARLLLLYVRDNFQLDSKLDPDREERDQDLHAAVRALTDELYVPTTIEMVADLQLSTAADLAKRHAPALFVLGRADESLNEAEVGVAVLEVLRGGHLPLLVVPETYQGSSTPTQAVVAADGEPFTLDKPLAALQLLAQLEPRMTVVTVSGIEDNQACATSLRQVKASGLADAASHVTLEAIRHTYPVEGLLKAITLIKADLLILVARRRSFLGTMFHRSVTNRLLRTCHIPMLVLPAIDG
ncbi:universal stress protein [Hymenobacter sp. BT188]|uniref:universal stress protein n=1 Tax=Hymenobacter sp. BT188 TaxID=2763504 RepID=UPI001650E818|nr:universal stress protein [Hymenobacter sp. BT188]MBC6608061.1 universal stress protein [Hymenobacter sp. BT188]